MGYLTRVAIALVGGLTVLAVVLAVLGFLVSREPSVGSTLDTDRSSARRMDFEQVGSGVIVPVDAAADLLNQCSRATVSPIDGFWRPTPRMVEELESRLPVFLAYESRLEPLDRYVRQYAGVVSTGRPLIYASFLASVPDERWQRQIVTVCDGGSKAWGVAFDVQTKTFGELHVNGAKSAAAAGAASSSTPDRWLGRWTGPEGTFLLVEGGSGTYDVTIQDLDGPRRFRGASVGERIEFDRDGVKESLRATDGAATGMKWLTDKSNCLTIRLGEGFCRD